MKEVMAIIRINMINKTKDALLKENFPSMTCRKAMGRGKKKVDYSLIESYLTSGDIPNKNIGEAVSEEHRLVPKRVLTLIVNDADVDKAVKTIIKTNSTGNPGDGKVFVLPIRESITVRTGELEKELI